jgi:hypothetical protein
MEIPTRPVSPEDAMTQMQRKPATEAAKPELKPQTLEPAKKETKAYRWGARLRGLFKGNQKS